MAKLTAEAAQPPADAIQDLLASIWARSLPLMRERFDSLDAFARENRGGKATEASRREAADTAHKLAGSLGMFGYERGTELARELETHLDTRGPLHATAISRLVHDLRQSVLPEH